MSELHYFLGVNVKHTVCSPDNGNIWITQPSYTQAVLQAPEVWIRASIVNLLLRPWLKE